MMNVEWRLLSVNRQEASQLPWLVSANDLLKTQCRSHAVP